MKKKKTRERDANDAPAYSTAIISRDCSKLPIEFRRDSILFAANY